MIEVPAPATLWTPGFEPGQVVTADALNQLSTLFHELGRFRTQQFFGHGVIWGLRSRLVGRDWELAPGAALDPLGRLIVVAERVRIPVDALPISENAERPDIRRHRQFSENYTPVLIYRSRRTKLGRHDVTAEIAMVPGRISADAPDAYRLRPLERMVDLRVADGAEFASRFEALQNDVFKEMQRDEDEAFGAHARSRIRALRLSESLQSGIPTSADLLTVGALNDTVHTLWQRARAQQYLKLRGFDSSEAWLRVDSGVEGVEYGVPLGWLFRDPERAWRWDGRWRAGFAIGLSRLELLGYAPRSLRQLGARRVATLLDAVAELRPMLPADRPESRREEEQPVAQLLTPRDYAGGTGAWLPNLRLDRPSRVAELWPLDPLRCALDAPVPVEPSIRDPEHDPRAEEGVPRCIHPAPSPMDPMNDPFTFCDYAEPSAVDRGGDGVVTLAGLIGFPVGRAWGVLARTAAQAGTRIDVAPRPIQIEDARACGDHEFVMLASLGEPLAIVTSKQTPDLVLGFARPLRASTTLRRHRAGRRDKSFLRWMFSR